MSDDPSFPAAAAGPIVQLDLREPHRHLVRVTLHITPRSLQPELRLPAWTPGSYLIRDYVRNLEALEVRQGDVPVATVRPAEACWRLELTSLAPLVVGYRLQATELSVRTCHLSADHGFLALAGVVLQVNGERWHPHRLELQLPEGWQAFVPLPSAGGNTWIAADFDRLIDSPIEAGPHPCHRFSVAGAPHRWVTWGADLPADDPAWLADVERVALACCRLMGEPVPASPNYLFVLHLLAEAYGGLEHDHASVLQFGRRALAAPGGRRKLLQLVAHEYLHQWNVRRLRPAELTPIDYDRATIVPGLWFAEGVTSYLDLLLPLAAGVGTEAELLEDLGADLSRYLLTPGRRVQGLRQSAEEAWVKLYRQDASSADSQISYYLKGAVVALVLDLHLRRHGSCLAVVLRALWRSHGAWGRGYRNDDLIAAFAGQAADLAELLPHWLESTDDPDLAGYLADVGLVLVPKPATEPFLGWLLEDAADRAMQLKRVHRNGPAERAQLQPGDELLALDGVRLRRPDDLSLAIGTSTAPLERQLLYCRDGRVRSTGLLPDPPAVASWQLLIDPLLVSEQSGLNRQRWLSLQP
ncbi:M61 family metallopeptidase [Synechococcus sp. BA-132 BA5]|uniref:M61 family metallopeptidase n=1 Tax=Synechococcus sp. BA-132 BA5 TaxID=3110252 RepID=UPI002B201891|nr:PDZ domain-containing protein [Synechococcus sp. BA-132 BA5]MEA5413662.1 PDZ domain-containing protein [Synechococcus sp. BA-132 BA5]